MATIVRCNCGAEYKRTQTKFLVPHTGDPGCASCGAALESWWNSTHIPSFELVKRPGGRPPTEADPSEQNSPPPRQREAEPATPRRRVPENPRNPTLPLQVAGRDR